MSTHCSRLARLKLFAFYLSTSLFSANISFAQDVMTGQKAVADPDEIVITATRRAESLQDVPIAVTALSGMQLQSAGVTNTQGIEQLTPGLVMAQTASAVQPTIRGVGSRSASPGEESNVALYLDGVYQPAMSSNQFDLLNVERVEVLKGPQGTLFGRNATGGAINIVTQKPSQNPELRMLASYGRFDEVRLATYATLGLTETLAADLAMQYRDTDGFVDDLVRGGKLGYRTDYNVRGRLRWQPSDRIDMVAALNYIDHEDTISLATQPIGRNTNGRRAPNVVVLPTKPWQFAGNLLPLTTADQFSATLTTSIDLGFASLEGASDYQKNGATFVSDSDGVAAQTQNPNSISNVQTSSASNELRLVSQGSGRLKWVVGATHFYLTSKYDPLLVNGTSVVRGRQQSSSYAVFGEATWQLLDPLYVTLGGRYSHERREVFPFVNVAFPSEAATYQNFDPRISLRYEFAPDNSLYATYSTGFKSGTFQPSSANPDPVRPEKIKAIEVGIKTRPLRWIRFNASGYYYDYSDLQVNARAPGGNTVILSNAAKARIKGIEGDLSLTPARGVSLRLSGSYTNAIYNDFPDAQITVPLASAAGVLLGGNSQIVSSVSGRDMIRAPRFTGVASGSYTFDTAIGGINVAANANYSDSYALDFSNRLKQPSFVLMNLALSWTSTDQRRSVRFWGRNVLNEAVSSYAFTSTNGDFTSFRDPASYGVTLELNW
ncbi:iron complex outermembrane receptor protein [Sphingobium sp. AEW010]|nr:iron complex outermembrane receptor protein [Sphingobium sp. AEW010]TWD18942.1 iron complex outermembrane receptor protein [Sphingobium sp. AEW013]TWD21813.1 iron complex outermembrane receptor protein [Sphingobium sp. AEW001]